MGSGSQRGSWSWGSRERPPPGSASGRPMMPQVAPAMSSELPADLDRQGRKPRGQQLAEQDAQAPGAEPLGGALDLGRGPPAVLGQQVQLALLEAVAAGLERRDARREDALALP